MSQAALSAGLALSFAAVAQNAEAQPAPKPTPNNQNIELETINVEGAQDGEDADGETDNNAPNALRASTGVSRLPGSVQDTPQIINVVPKEILKQQKVDTLEQALRNVPGVTTNIGEGGSGLSGDQFRIRGFQAKGDIYTDGLRDFGVYVRDSFAYEDVQVLKGPSSESFGMGTGGGVINARIKQAHKGDAYSFDATAGTGPLGRAVIDLNKQIDETSAARIVVMGNEQDIVDRDHVESDRYGALGSLSFGLGTDTTLNLNYFYQHTDRTPDYGVPLVARTGTASITNPALPVTEFNVPRDSFYGVRSDKDVSDVNMFTSMFTKEATDWLTIHNDTRLAHYERSFRTSVPECRSSATATCLTEWQTTGDGTIAYGGGNPAYDQESWGVQNITSAIAKFGTGFLRHEAVVGLDLFYQDDHKQNFSSTRPVSGATLLNPVYDTTVTYTPNAGNIKDANSFNVGIFASDRVWLNDQFSVLGGLRYDDYSANLDYTYDPAAANGVDLPLGTYPFQSDSEFLSPKLSFIWEPTKQQTYYVSWATAASPAGQFITNEVTPIGTTLNQQSLEPEETETYEAGAKISILDGRIGLTGAVFQVEKDNTVYTDLAGNTTPSGDQIRVRGVELGISGMVTDAWRISGAYAYNDGEITGVATGTTNVGNDAPFVSEHTASIWTSYEVSRLFQNVPGTWLVGGGIVYRSEYFTNNQNTNLIPETFSVDLFSSYEIDKYRFAINAYNITDELNYSSAQNDRAVPAPGRTISVSMGVTF